MLCAGKDILRGDLKAVKTLLVVHKVIHCTDIRLSIRTLNPRAFITNSLCVSYTKKLISKEFKIYFYQSVVNTVTSVFNVHVGN